jgi:cold shock CspA family protein/ribosome-associated translation inhibitor RaiA
MQIPMKITFHGLNQDPALEGWIREWADKLETIYPRISRCDVAVEAPHSRQGPQYHVRIDLTVPNSEIVVSREPGPSEAHRDPYVAVRDSFRAARRQLDDYVRKNLHGEVKSRVRPTQGLVSYVDAEQEWGLLDTEDGRQIYFHRNSVVGGIDRLQVGSEVRFAETEGEKGPQATTVDPIGEHGHHEVRSGAEPS